MAKFNLDEYYEIVEDLSIFHEVFSALWKLSRPRFDNDIPTAAVFFDPAGGCIDFAINPDFWDSLDNYTKKFVVCHEMIHVVNCHGLRSIPFRDKYTREVINIALDLADNHMLTNNFGFNRFRIKDWNKACWCDTVLKDLELEPNKSFEYYIMKVQENLHKIKVNIVIQDHKGLDTFNQQATSSIQKNVNKILGQLDTNGEKEQDKQSKDLLTQQAGGGAGMDEASNFSIFTGSSITVKKLKKWDSILTKYCFKKEKEKESLQWIRSNRRMTLLSSDIILPSENETVEREAQMFNVDLFLDYSGSCSHLQDIFFAASRTFDPRKFRIRKYAHTTKVAEFEGDNVKVFGGGTEFGCIEEHIQQKIAKKEILQYPDCIMHFTDGESYRHFTIEKPERWHVFLTENGMKQYFPPGVNFYKLSDFVEFKENRRRGW